MIQLYTGVLIIECLALGVLCALVCYNRQLSKAEKIRFCITYVVLLLTATTEWLAIYLNGRDENLRPLHIIAKCLDYILTPVVAVFFVRQVAQLKRIEPFFLILLGLNTILQIVSCFTHWTFYIDEVGYYQHGPVHWIYIAIYIIAIAYVILGFIVYAKRFPRQNLVPFLLLIGLAVLGVIAQETISDFFEGNLRIGTLSLVFASILLYIHYVSFSQQQKDLELSDKDKLLRVDALSNCLSRFAYNQVYTALSSSPLPEDFAVMYIDLNGLKGINDKYGHEKGDEYIKSASAILRASLAGKGECFRTGGDEFLIFLHADYEELENIVSICRVKALEWDGMGKEKMSFAIGYATVKIDKEDSLEKLITIADNKMYEEKKRYYEKYGLRRAR